ncbi:MAG: alpha/beta hydrolase family protein [Micromonosporaceae bacterium]
MSDPREVLTRPAAPPALTVRYGGHPDHVADVWSPAAGARPAVAGLAPLVVYVHGGFWRAQWDRTHARPLCQALSEAGYAVAAIEYRRVGQRGGGWPGSFDDVALALDTVPALVADRLGQLGPVVHAGHSAGGHFVLWDAVRHRLPRDTTWHRDTRPELAGVLALAPVCDLAAGYRDRLGDGAVGELLGGGPDAVPDRYAVADPAALPYPQVPAVLVHGTADDRVPVTQSESYTAPAGGDAPAGADPVPRLVAVPGADHFAVIDPLSGAWPHVLAALASLSR